MDELLERYFETFGESFPNFVFTGTDEEMKEVIKECIEKNEPYEPEYKEGVIY
jgi:hypothetical protein